jgi:hypothetical protein
MVPPKAAVCPGSGSIGYACLTKELSRGTNQKLSIAERGTRRKEPLGTRQTRITSLSVAEEAERRKPEPLHQPPLENEADGIRTRNHRIDSPVL